MISNTSLVKTVVVTSALLSNSYALVAAPLPNGTLLGLQAGASPDGSGQCQVGSCFGMEVSPNFWIWTMVEPGLDGGFIVGKDQSCGGQEIGPSATNTTPGDLTGAWFFFGAYGTLCADNRLNVFSDTSNDGATVINDLNVAWNGGIIPLGGGSVNDYVINMTDEFIGTWSMEYTAVVPSGQFQGVNFWLQTRGAVNIPDVVPCNCPPVVNNINISIENGMTADWIPDFSSPLTDGLFTCGIMSQASNGIATVSTDCSSGTYTSGAGYVGMDSFTYVVTDQHGLSGTGTVSVEVTPFPGEACFFVTPISEVTTVGGGQSVIVNSAMTTTFTGHITKQAGLTSGGRNTVKICSDTTVDYMVSTSVGSATCLINNAASASVGTLATGDKLICTNKPEGGDTDRFTIKNGL